MFLTFEFKEPLELSLIAWCVVLKISACLHILIFHDDDDEEKIFSCLKGEISKTLYQI